MADYQAKLAELQSPADIASRLARARKLAVQYGPYLSRYHGGLPVGILAAIMQMESDGNMGAPGDVSLGEIGLYQVTAEFPTTVGVNPAVRTTVEGNVFLGSLNYQIEAARFAALFPMVAKGSEDQWKLARLSFAIGSAGAKDLVTRALAWAGVVRTGNVYNTVRRYVDQGGATAAGSQSADKVWYRVHVVDSNFELGKKIGLAWFGPPQVIPAPAGVTYKFPPSLLPYTGKPMTAVLALGALALVAFFIARR